MAIYFLRHGKTPATIGNKLNWWEIDQPLATDWLVDFESVDFRDKLISLNIQTIISSPLKRAIQTAKIVSKLFWNNIDIKLEPFFQEQKFWDYSGKSFDEILCWKVWYDMGNISLLYRTSPPNWESWIDFVDRVRNWYNNIEDKNKNILIVSHGWVYRAFMEILKWESSEKVLLNKDYRIQTLEIKPLIF